MSKITLRPYQINALKKAVEVDNTLLCLETGSGKTIITTFLARYLLSKSMTDKYLVACTKSSINVFIKDFKDKFNIDVTLIDSIGEFKTFINSKNKIALFKHSMFEKIGMVEDNIKYLKQIAKKEGIRLSLAIDEAHLLSNTKGVGHQSFRNISPYFIKTTLLTATPYSSKLEQVYGLVCLIRPKLWKNIYEFNSLFLEQKDVKDWKTGKFKYRETVRYINLPLLRKTLEPFTFFYFPKMELVYHSHSIKLKDYTEYDKICEGILDMDIDNMKEESLETDEKE